MDKIKIKISEDYTKTPGVREDIEGDYSGEEFLNVILLPKFQQAIEQNVTLCIDFDGGAGYPTSFLEAAFGGLARHFKNPALVLSKLEYISEDDPFLVTDVREYIIEANNE